MRRRNLLRKKREAGFSLIQMSIILGASAIMLTSVIPGKEAGDYNKKVEISLKRLAKVEDAMKGFVAAYGRRPCPADGQYGVGNENFGKEAENRGTCTGGMQRVAPLGPDATTQFVVGGTIPTKTLNISDEYAFDAWGRQFTYVVDTRATKITSCVDLQRWGNGAVVVKGAVANQDQYVMYAYISHGPDGHGGWPRQGSSVADRINAYSADADTQDNASVDGSFNVAFDNEFVRKQRTPTFDDVVYYDPKTKNTCCVGAICDITPEGWRTDDHVPGNNPSDEQNDVGAVIAAGHGLLVVGVPDSAAWSGNKTQAGSVYIIKPDLWGAFPESLYDPRVLRIDGEVAQDRFGAAVAIGQLNGSPSIIIGAPGHDANWGCTIANGSVYILFDISGAKSSTQDPGKTGAHDVSDRLGLAPLKGIRMDGVFTELLVPGKKNTLATGDINGDGTDDLVIGWGHDEKVFTVYGGNDWGTSATWQLSHVNEADFPKGHLIIPEAGYTGIGSVLATGDINGDGEDDILIGYGEGNTNEVHVAFFDTFPDPLVDPRVSLNPANTFRITGMDSAFDTSTLSLASGNINNDGYDDIVIGNNGVNLAGGGGYVVFGGNSFIPGGSMDVSTLNGTNGFEMRANDLQAAGRSVASGDINGDNYDDILVGSPLQSSGRVYVVFGQDAAATPYDSPFNLNTLNGTNGFILQGPAVESEFGANVASNDLGTPPTAGNPGNNFPDGFSDMFVGAPKFDNPRHGHGSVYEVYGKAAGWSPSLDLGALP